MSLSITFRGLTGTEALKAHVDKRVTKFRKYVTYPLEIMARLSLEKMYHCVEITVNAEHRSMVAVAKTKDLYESIDLAVKKIEAQLKKERERHKGHGLAHEVAHRTSKEPASDVTPHVPHLEKKRSRR